MPHYAFSKQKKGIPIAIKILQILWNSMEFLSQHTRNGRKGEGGVGKGRKRQQPPSYIEKDKMTPAHNKVNYNFSWKGQQFASPFEAAATASISFVLRANFLVGRKTVH